MKQEIDIKNFLLIKKKMVHIFYTNDFLTVPLNGVYSSTVS